ncbi:unnamed protein product [Closterium sp. NIES-64]|nr:unnamed protein product [Closterium sp. NIES-64]
MALTPRTVRFLNREQRLLWLEREEWERFEEGSLLQQQVQLQLQQERVEESRLQQQEQERVEEELRSQQEAQLQLQQESAEEEPQEQQQRQVPSQHMLEEAEQQRLARPCTYMLGSWSPTIPSCSSCRVPFIVPVNSSFSPQSCCVSRA